MSKQQTETFIFYHRQKKKQEPNLEIYVLTISGQPGAARVKSSTFLSLVWQYWVIALLFKLGNLQFWLLGPGGHPRPRLI